MKHIITLLIIALSIPSFAQLQGQALIDSLEAELPNAKADTNHVNLLNKLTGLYYYSNKTLAKEYTEKSLELSNKIDWKEGIISSYQNLGLINSDLGDNKKALEYYNKAEKLAIEEDEQSLLANVYNFKSVTYERLEDLVNANSYKLKYIAKTKENKDTLGIAKALFDYHTYQRFLGNFDEALKYAFEAANLWETTDFNQDLDLYIRILNNIAINYAKIKDYESAVNYYNKAERFGDSTNHRNGLMRIWVNRASIFTKMERFEDAEKDLNKCFEYLEKRGGFNDYNVTVGLALAEVYDSQLRFDEAIDLLEDLLIKTKTLNQNYWISTVYGFISNIHFNMAEDSTISKIDGDKTKLISNKFVNYRKSIEYLNKSEEYYPKNNILVFKSMGYDALASAYANLGDFEKAYEIQKEYTIAKDSVLNSENLKEVGRLEAERESIIQQFQQEEEARKAEARADQRNRLQYLGIGAVIVAFGVLLLLSGQMQLSEWKARALVFLTFIFLFEFILVIIDPFTDEYSEGIPLIKFGINMCLALVIFPMHQYFEKRVSLKVVKPDSMNTEQILEEFRKRKAEES